MNTLLFAVGSFIFMFTVYGTVVSGGRSLKRKQRQEFGPDQRIVVDDDGWEILVTRAERADENSPSPSS